jgi:zinc protease
MLGASIYIRASNDDITLSANCLARNYDQVLALVEEILLEPRWDEEEFELAKTKMINRLVRNKANPGSLARNAFNELVYGKEHIFSIDRQGTEESIGSMAISDLKDYYTANFSPSVATFQVAGDIDKGKVMTSLESVAEKWTAKEVTFPGYTLPKPPESSRLIFVDVPGAKQSVINIGTIGLARTDPDYYAVTVMNQKLGGSFNGFVNLVLREEKGFTYGARTRFSGSYIPGTFIASSSVRSSATLESVQIFKELMEEYRNGISEEDLMFTKNSLLKSNARDYETLRALVYMLETIAMYDLPKDFVKGEEEVIRNMTLEQHKELAQKYIQPDRMYYVIAGDAATQVTGLENVGFGEPVLFD